MRDKDTESFWTFSYEEELQAKWLKQDLEKGEDWTKAAEGPGCMHLLD